MRIPYIYDPSQQIPRLEPDQLVKGVEGAKVLVVNDYEFEMMKNKTGLSEDDIRSKVETVIITQGEEGSLIYTDNQKFDIPSAKPNRVAEPTGAGDAFRAGIIAGMMRGYSWDVIGRLGSVAAVYVLEQHGTQRHTFTRRQLANRYREAFGETNELDDFVNYTQED